MMACDQLSVSSADPALADISHLLTRNMLEDRLLHDFGSIHPFRLARPTSLSHMFEAWAPLGLLVHVMPSADVALLSAVEGLLTGNFNVMLAANPPCRAIAKLCALDTTGQLASRIAVLYDSAETVRWLRSACTGADGIVTWNDEDVSPYLPPSCRLVRRQRGMTIAYVTRDAWSDESVLRRLADSIGMRDGSGPQTVYLDTDSMKDIRAFEKRFRTMSVNARHVEIKSMPRDRLRKILWPIRNKLWTVGIAGDRSDVAELSRMALAVGACHVISLGPTSDLSDDVANYSCYTLQQYSRRVSVRVDERFANDACLDDLGAARPFAIPQLTDPPISGPQVIGTAPDVPVLTKFEAQRRIPQISPEHAELYFHSGGTTGIPGISVYTYDDYAENTRATAEGLLAAGLNPRRDRTANLFQSGMGGGYASFFEVLERLRVIQIPISANAELRSIAAAIIQHQVDTLIGMPSDIWRICHTQETPLRAYGGIRQVFYAGEHFSLERRRWLEEELGVEIIRSAAYTTTDLGPLGYQCTYITGTTYHLHTDLHILEILDLDSDRPASRGRLIFTRKTRRGQNLDRYEIGDVGQWVSGDCSCGRRNPRFEVLGRHGDIIRIATWFINYQRLGQIAGEKLGYIGDLQVVIDHRRGQECLTVRLDSRYVSDLDHTRDVFITSYPELRTAIEQEMLLLVVDSIDQASFSRSPTNQKLQTVIDLRSRSLLDAIPSAHRHLSRVRIVYLERLGMGDMR